MICRVSTLCDKEVVNVTDGVRLGTVDDVEVNIDTAEITSIIVYGKGRFFGLFGKGEDIIICWDHIKLVGEDTVLVCIDASKYKAKKKKSLFSSLFQ